jgi:hypothetical protein
METLGKGTRKRRKEKAKDIVMRRGYLQKRGEGGGGGGSRGTIYIMERETTPHKGKEC